MVLDTVEESAGEPVRPTRPRRQRRRLAGVSIALLVALIVSGALFIYIRYRNHDTSGIPHTIINAAAFPVYYYAQDPPAGYAFVKGSASLSNGVLVYRLKHGSTNKQVVVSEQALTNYDFESLQADQDFRTPAGHAYITDGAGRTTGALFTDDKTWVLMNAPDPIGADSMRSLLADLSPQRR